MAHRQYSLIIAFVFAILPSFADAATMSVIPPKETYGVGDRITTRISVSGNMSLNALSGTLIFPTSHFSIESVSKNGSILNFWVQGPTFSKNSGTVNFEGVALDGFVGSNGTVITVTSRALAVGTANVSFQSGQILANDGSGTDITGSLIGATYTIIEAKPKIEAETSVLESEAEVNIETNASLSMRPPEISVGTKYGEQAILGTSQNGSAKVLLTFTASNGTRLFITGNADTDGGFTLLVPRSLKRGTYSISAIMIGKNDAYSDKSNTLTIVVGSIFSDIGWEIWLALILLILTLIYLMIRITTHLQKDKIMRAMIKEESKEAQGALHKTLDVLRGDLLTDAEGDLNRAERISIAKIRKDIDEVEDVVRKEIKDIESL